MEQPFVQLLLLLGTTVAVVVAFQRMHIPTSLAYLMVGVLLGPYTAGPAIEGQQLRILAEFGIVFLLFTIGLNFTLPQIYALRHRVLGLGTAQVLLTTVVVGLIAWLAGLSPVAAFVVGAVFAQSSTTIISRQLAEQHEEQSTPGKLGTAMSVFQDVTAVPFVVIIPVLGAASGALALGTALAWAMAKAVIAFGLVFLAGRWILRPLFDLIAKRNSAELFTLTVLFVCLVAAWTTSSFGLSMAFGAFLTGMMLGETEFRHQIEATIRPFRDVLLGLFFVGIGMLFDPLALGRIWPWVLAGTNVLLGVKIVLVALMTRWSGLDSQSAWRTGLLLAVGGEFGFALLALALDAGAISDRVGQIALSSVLCSMVIAPFLIRYNQQLASWLVPNQAEAADTIAPVPDAAIGTFLDQHVIICGYGRIGQGVGQFLKEEEIPYVALDLDSSRVKAAHAAGEPVYYGDAAERNLLEALQLERARLLVISHEDLNAALKVLDHVRVLRPGLPVMVRTRDETHVETLRAAGATEIVPETLEAGLMIASHVLLQLGIPSWRVLPRIQAHRNSRYRLLHEIYKAEHPLPSAPAGG